MKILLSPALEKKIQQAARQGALASLFPRKPPPKTPDEETTDILKRVLDNRFVLVRDGMLGDAKTPVSLLLASPAGIHRLITHDLRGRFRASGAIWEKLEQGSGKFKPSRPNLIQEAMDAASQAKDLLAQHGHPRPEVEAVLVFTHPGAHLELARPDVRILTIDALERFGSALMQANPVLSIEEARRIAARFTHPAAHEALPSKESRDMFSLADEPTPARPPVNLELPDGARVSRAINRLPMKTWQWAVVGFLVLVNIAIILLVIFVILKLS